MQVVTPVLEANNLAFPNDETFAKLLLYGHETLSKQLNLVVINETVKFIHTSERFSSTDGQ